MVLEIHERNSRTKKKNPLRCAVKLESLGDWCCLIKNKLILLYSAVMIGTQTCSQVPMNPRYIQYYTYSIHRDKYLFGQKLVSQNSKIGFGPGSEPTFFGGKWTSFGATKPSQQRQPAIPPVHEHFGSGHDLPHTQLDIHAPCGVLWTRPESGNTFFLNLAGILTVLGEGCKTRILRAIYVF